MSTFMLEVYKRKQHFGLKKQRGSNKPWQATTLSGVIAFVFVLHVLFSFFSTDLFKKVDYTNFSNKIWFILCEQQT